MERNHGVVSTTWAYENSVKGGTSSIRIWWGEKPTEFSAAEITGSCTWNDAKKFVSFSI